MFCALFSLEYQSSVVKLPVLNDHIYLYNLKYRQNKCETLTISISGISTLQGKRGVCVGACMRAHESRILANFWFNAATHWAFLFAWNSIYILVYV